MAGLCSVQDVLDIVGPGANPSIIDSESIIVRIINKSEKVVIAKTRIDWLGGSGSVSSYVMGLVQNCVAHHSAKQIINNYMGAFTSRQEATTMLNIVYDEYVQSLNDLKNPDTQNIRAVGS